MKDEKNILRLIKIEISNFKNVKHGEIELTGYSLADKKAEVDDGDVNGIYGQNGSGKTAVVDALRILKYITSSESIPFDEFAELCHDDKGSEFNFTFLYLDEIKKLKVNYKFNIIPDLKKRVINIVKEKISIYKKSAGWIGYKEYVFENNFYDENNIPDFSLAKIKSNNSYIFNDKQQYKEIVNIVPTSTQSHISLFFNKFFYENFLKKEVIAYNNSEKFNEELTNFENSILYIHNYFIQRCQIISAVQLSAIYNQNITLMNVHYTDLNSLHMGAMPIITSGVFNIVKDNYPVYEKVITIINIAIKALIPNIQLSIEKVNDFIDNNNNVEMSLINIFSIRNGKKISLRFESEGIKRIISLLSCLIEVFNNKNYCLVVDEIDSGIFEYLLGELIGILKENAKGQIIFTSHNLRILEKLDSKNIICTTINPENRYIHLQYIERTNNVRSMYLRTLILGGQKEGLYDDVDLSDLGLAFRKAGLNND